MSSPASPEYFPTFRRFRRWLSKEDGLASRHVGSSVLAVGVILILAIAFLTLAIREHTSDDARTNEQVGPAKLLRCLNELTVQEPQRRQRAPGARQFGALDRTDVIARGGLPGGA